MTRYEYLKNDKEPIPNWLLEIKEGDKFSRDDFFSSRIVFYPGLVQMLTLLSENASSSDSKS